jgi:hypothetical protein
MGAGLVLRRFESASRHHYLRGYVKVHIGNYRVKSEKPRIERVKIDSFDSYSAYHTLALIIHPLLIEFRNKIKQRGGYPSSIIEGSCDDSDETYEQNLNKWVDILDKMIWSFSEIVNDNPGEHKYFADDGKLDMAGMLEYYKRIQEGLDLFGKHYQSLWW